jgi:hypothetical protein
LSVGLGTVIDPYTSAYANGGPLSSKAGTKGDGGRATEEDDVAPGPGSAVSGELALAVTTGESSTAILNDAEGQGRAIERVFQAVCAATTRT